MAIIPDIRHYIKCHMGTCDILENCFICLLPFYCWVAQGLFFLRQQVSYSHNTDHTQTEWTHLYQMTNENSAELSQGHVSQWHFQNRSDTANSSPFKVLLHITYKALKGNLFINYLSIPLLSRNTNLLAFQ